MTIKKSAFSGSWYPSSSAECEKEIALFLKSSLISNVPEADYSAGISPHAGWYFSGAIACNVIRLLKGDVAPDLIVLFGKHMHKNSPATILASGSCETPFGYLDIDTRFAENFSARVEIKKELPEHFVAENTIELQLPFIKYFFGDVKIAVIGVPPNPDALVLGQRVVQSAKEMNISLKIIGSTDLTHYGSNFGFSPHGFGEDAVEWVKQKNDRAMIHEMLSLDGENILNQSQKNQNACCGGAVAATVAAAKELGLDSGHEVAYATSHDLSPGDSFVGYTGIVY